MVLLGGGRSSLGFGVPSVLLSASKSGSSILGFSTVKVLSGNCTSVNVLMSWSAEFSWRLVHEPVFRELILTGTVANRRCHLPTSIDCGKIVSSFKRFCRRTDKSRDGEVSRDRHKSKEVVLQHLCQIQSLERVDDQTLSDEIFGTWVHAEVIAFFREFENSSFNLFVCIFDFLRLKWRSSTKHGVKNDSNWPVVDFETVTIVWFKNFGSKVVGCSTHSLFAFSRVEYLSSEPKISNFELHVFCKEEISKLEISVNYILAMTVLASQDELVDVVASFNLMQPLATSEEIGQGLVMTNVKH